MAEPPVSIVCSWCGSERVSRDAWADWDVAGQAWVLEAVFDQGYCHACEREVELVRLTINAEARYEEGR